MNVKEDTISVAAHFFLEVQFFGFSGSSGPVHATYTELAGRTDDKRREVIDLDRILRGWRCALVQVEERNGMSWTGVLVGREG